MNADILVHPGFCFNPHDIAALEHETGLKCKRTGALVVRLVPAEEFKKPDLDNHQEAA